MDLLMITRRYGPLREPTSSSCGGLRPLAEVFFALRAKEELIMLFWAIFGIFWCPVVTLVTFSINLSNFERIPPPKKNVKIQKISVFPAEIHQKYACTVTEITQSPHKLQS